MSASGINIIFLNVGGKRFQVSKCTLTQGVAENTYLSKRFTLFVKGEDDHVTGEGDIFIDRNPDAFPWILSFLRGYRMEFPEDNETYQMLKQDAEFYGITALIEIISLHEKDLKPLLDMPEEYFKTSLKEMQTEERELVYMLWILERDGIFIPHKKFTVSQSEDKIDHWTNLKEMRESYKIWGKEQEKSKSCNQAKYIIELICVTAMYHFYGTSPQETKNMMQDFDWDTIWQSVKYMIDKDIDIFRDYSWMFSAIPNFLALVGKAHADKAKDVSK
jgi:hypothetical protein